jgi:uncharacterized protein YndB with AHSA1/START domain
VTPGTDTDGGGRGFQVAVEIGRSPAEVFAFVAEARNMPRWYDAVVRVEPTTPGPPAAGSRYDVVRDLPGGRVHNDVEITEFEPDRLVTFESRSGPTPFRYRYTLAPGPGPGTRLRLEGRIRGAGLPGPLGHLGPVATQLFKRGMAHNLATLKQILEAEAPR